MTGDDDDGKVTHLVERTFPDRARVVARRASDDVHDAPLPPLWTEAVRDACSARCGNFGEPPCHAVVDNAAPCRHCLKDAGYRVAGHDIVRMDQTGTPRDRLIRCQMPVRMSKLETRQRKIRVARAARLKMEPDLCAAVASFYVGGMPACRAHASAVALNQFVEED